MKSIKEKFKAIEINKTWELTILPKNKEAINVRWVFKIKMKPNVPNGSLVKHKSSLVARGFLQNSSLEYFEVF